MGLFSNSDGGISKNLSLALATAFLLTLLIPFQNCGQYRFSKEEPPPIITPEFVDKQVLAIYRDLNNDDAVNSDEPRLGEIEPFSGELDAKDNYGYSKRSANPAVGPVPVADTGNIFMYQQQGSQDMYLVIIFNKEQNETAGPISTNQVNWKFVTTGNPKDVTDSTPLDAVELVDDQTQAVIDPATGKPQVDPATGRGIFIDDPELTILNEDTTAGRKVYRGKWSYTGNTDGGVIGPFRGKDFQIAITARDRGNIREATFHSPGRPEIPLDSGETGNYSFIIKSEIVKVLKN